MDSRTDNIILRSNKQNQRTVNYHNAIKPTIIIPRTAWLLLNEYANSPLTPFTKHIKTVWFRLVRSMRVNRDQLNLPSRLANSSLLRSFHVRLNLVARELMPSMKKPYFVDYYQRLCRQKSNTTQLPSIWGKQYKRDHWAHPYSVRFCLFLEWEKKGHIKQIEFLDYHLRGNCFYEYIAIRIVIRIAYMWEIHVHKISVATFEFQNCNDWIISR